VGCDLRNGISVVAVMGVRLRLFLAILCLAVVPVEASELPRAFEVSGKNPDSSAYTGTLLVEKGVSAANKLNLDWSQRVGSSATI